MMGRLESVQDQFFYNFRLDDIVPADHLSMAEQKGTTVAV